MSKKLLKELATKHGIQNIREYGKTIVIPDVQFDRSWTKPLEKLGCRVITKKEGARCIVLPKDPAPKTPRTFHKKGGPKPTSTYPRKWTKEQDDLILSLMDPKKQLAPQIAEVYKKYHELKKPEWRDRPLDGFTRHTYRVMATLKAATDVKEPSIVVDNVVVDEAANTKKPEKKPKRGWAMKWTNEQDAVLTNAVDPKKNLWSQGKKILEEYNKIKKPEWPTRTLSGIKNRIYLLLKGVPDVEEPEILETPDLKPPAAATGKSEIKSNMMYGVTPRLPFFAVEPETNHLARVELTELLKELEFLVSSIKKKLEERGNAEL